MRKLINEKKEKLFLLLVVIIMMLVTSLSGCGSSETTRQDENNLWDLVSELKSPKYKWVNLSYELSSDTPHWYGFKPFSSEILFDYAEGTDADKLAPMRCFEYTVTSQYGTHVDVPSHFHENGRSLDAIRVDELMYPLVVIDKSKECAQNPDFTLSVDDLKAWEKEYGKIPENAFVAFRSDWSKKDDIDNPDENGVPHYPGWSLEAVQWLVEERNIGAIGHETADSDPGYITTNEDIYPYPVEQYILCVDRFQIELMCNLDKCSPTGSIICMGFPLIKDGTGSPAIVYAIVPEK